MGSRPEFLPAWYGMVITGPEDIVKPSGCARVKLELLVLQTRADS